MGRCKTKHNKTKRCHHLVDKPLPARNILLHPPGRSGQLQHEVGMGQVTSENLFKQTQVVYIQFRFMR